MNDFCRHFHGIHLSDKCDKGIEYKSVRSNGSLPCFDPALGHLCKLREGYTPEEIEEQEAAIAQAVIQFADMLSGKSDKCPHCGATIEEKKQVGRSVYGRPCGCRLYQGRLPK